MKYLKKAILIIVILIVLILLTLLIILKNKKTENSKIADNNSIQGNIVSNTTNTVIEPNYSSESFEQHETLNYVESVTDINEYFTVKEIVKDYIINVKNKNTDFLKSILAKKYVDKYNINDNNMFTKLNYPETTNSDQYYNIVITDMLRINLGGAKYLYISKEKCRIVNKNQAFETVVMIEMDYQKNIYCVYPQQFVIDNGIDKIKKGNHIENNINEDLQFNGNNKFIEQHKSNQDLIKEYFNNYKELLIYYPNEAYSKLNQEYSAKKFINKDNFTNYLKENSTMFGTITISEYKLELCEGYRDYICTDQYNNIYTFRVIKGDLINYQVFLDDYAIIPEYEKVVYNSLDDYQKAKENVKIFKNMLNNKDYSAIYNILDSTFKANNFGSVEKLKNYLENNVYKINNIEITDFDMDDSDYYVYECELQNKENSKEKKNMNIIIKLGEGTSFTMSFSFN